MRRFLWVPFAVALAGFILPFATVSCGGSRVEPSGADFVLRTPPTVEGPEDDRLVEIGEFVVEYGGGLATAAFLAFVAALIAARGPWSRGWSALGGLVGLAALVALWKRDSRPGAAGADAVVVDVEVGAVLAVVAGGLGTAAAATVWLREEHPTAPPVVPAVGAGLLLLGYLLPIVASGFPNGAYADSLNVREPWEAVFWLLAPAFGLALVARGRSPTTFLAGFALAIFVGGGAAVVHHVWTMRPFDELVLGPHVYFGGLVLSAASAIGHVQRRQLAAIVLPFLVGAVVSGVAVVLSDAPWEWTVAALAGATAVVFVLARRGRAGRPAAGERSEPAPAPGSPPPSRSAPGSGGSPPAAP